MTRRYVLAHDLGTTGNKAVLYDQNGRMAGSATVAYATEYAHPGWAEQDPEDWWRAVCDSTRRLLHEADVAPSELACVAFSGQMMGCVPVDRRARPLRKAIIWADQRAVAQERWVAERVAPADVYRITGHRLSASYSLCKLLWLRDHQSEVYRSAHKFLHAKDAMIARLTGAFVTEPSDASGTNLYDLMNGSWSAPIVDALGLNSEQLPSLRRSIDVVGEVSAEAAEQAGLALGTPVVAGGGDGPCAATGAGVVREGAAYNYIGASSWIALASRQPIWDPAQRTFTFGHVVPGMMMPTGTMQAAGTSYQWARDQLCHLERNQAESVGESVYALMDEAARRSPPGANGLLFLPYLLGERSPRWNPRARGAFVGLTIRHTHSDMVRSVLEGVTLNLRVILCALQAQGAGIEAVRLIGGGARGRFWNQLMADVYGLPVQRMAVLEEATSMGAAVIGGVGVGLYSDFSMAEQMNEAAETFWPNPADRAVYARLAPIFESAYDGLLPVFDALSASG
ncbi:MAG: xylulokinase [Anaerolineales bacterium]|nr:xylulokinase [Anaerolineales bacterium]